VPRNARIVPRINVLPKELINVTNSGNADAVPRIMFGSRIYLPVTRNVRFDPRSLTQHDSPRSPTLLGA
jgi:hypothetical protein